mgnify:CR=1 FL=1|tara:strand:+ start:472 stop:1404 length:933 start_codon:yes stop_codon:yes gene_type:complete
MSFKILFMGTPNFAVPILNSLFETKHKILEVYTKPPSKKYRGLKTINSPVHEFSKKNNIPVRCPISLESENELNHFKKLKPDIVIVVAYGKILPQSFLNLDKTIFVNLHASLLPKWRGAAPIQRSILNMDKETGVSIMKIVPKLDAGPVLIQSKIKIFKKTTYEELCSKMSNEGARLIIKSLELIQNNKANFIHQNESQVTYAKKIQKFESKIDWNESADKIIAKINAFNPNPGCWFDFYGARVKIIKAIEVSDAGHKPGTILNDKLTIACSKNAVQILELKKESKKKMSVEDFLRGNKINIGENLIVND